VFAWNAPDFPRFERCTALAILRCAVRLSLFSACLTTLAVACSPSHDTPPGDASLVVGVQNADGVTPIGNVHVVAKVNGQVASDQVYPTLPKEIPLAGSLGAKVDVDVEGFQAGAPPGSPPILTRLASSHLVAGKKLLRLILDPACATVTLPGAPPPSTCAAPLTCSGGRCVASDVNDADLEDYDPQWASAPPDICRPVHHGAPEVTEGLGQLDYATLSDEQVVQLEEGPQGGHHVWIAVRMRNLRRSGSISSLTARVLDDPSLVVPPAAFVFTFDPDEGGYCKLAGLRYQIDAGATDLVNAYKPFLGKRIEVTLTVTDSLKESATSTRIIHLGDTLICRDGTDSCNQR
jgi:hypothetical protein